MQHNRNIMPAVNRSGTNEAMARLPRPARFYAGNFRVGCEQSISVRQNFWRFAVFGGNGVRLCSDGGGESGVLQGFSRDVRKVAGGGEVLRIGQAAGIRKMGVSRSCGGGLRVYMRHKYCLCAIQRFGGGNAGVICAFQQQGVKQIAGGKRLARLHTERGFRRLRSVCRNGNKRVGRQAAGQ